MLTLYHRKEIDMTNDNNNLYLKQAWKEAEKALEEQNKLNKKKEQRY